jgi:Mrp family chromosome partitioning ATPase
MRLEFDYSIVEGPPPGESNKAMAMAQFADGIILVLSARHTRRVAARKMKEMLEEAHARILGIVLSDRVFPIPRGIYRRL